MFFIFKELQKLSLKNGIWLLILVSIYSFILLMLIHMLIAFSDSMSDIVSILRQAKPNTKHILLLSKRMRKNNRLKECESLDFDCVLTENRALLGGDITKFDAIVFDETHLYTKWEKHRARSQLYIFTTIESPAYHPACELRYDDFFNWTFTYRLDSDVTWQFFVVRNTIGDIVAPSKNVQWNTSLHPVPGNIKTFFRKRKRAAAWIVSNCDSLERNKYLTKLREYLTSYSLQIDVYGACNKRKCNGDCNRLLRKNYYFYMAFENSFAEDYITEKVKHGYDNYLVPIVYGAANYSRFLPPGSYIDARQLHPYNLAHIMNYAIEHSEVYESYFLWTNFYTFDFNYRNFNPACTLCKAINSTKAKYAPAKKKFRFWWNTMQGMKWCLPDEYWHYYNMINLS